jgi:hypothetical protein
MLAAALCFALAPAAAVAAFGENRVDYAITARIDDPAKHLDGSLVVQWTNGSSVPARDLWFHLYLNAFANNRSTHMVEAKGALRGVDFKEGWGWQRVTSVRAGGEDLTASFRYRQPDDHDADDMTVASVELPKPVAPGETIDVEVRWESQLPRCRRRTGVKDDFILGAQWFPKLGVFQGERGWNCHQFHSSTEFFSDYGTYDVVLDLPVRYAGKVFGSGRVEASEVNGDRVVTRIFAPSHADRERVDSTGKRLVVHDFTWTADPRYAVHAETFRVDEWMSRFPGEVAFAQRAFGVEHDLGLRNVDVTVLIHRERDAQWRRHYEATCAALFFYGLWFGGYPYEHVTLVDPAWGAGAGGMEYPTLFTAGTQLFTSSDMHTPEGVTVHECGHQFWYGLVGNNEFESSWMDEGFNTFTTSEALVRAFGERRATTSYSGLFADGVPIGALGGGDAWSDALSARALPFWSLKPLRDSDFVDWWRDQPQIAFASQHDDPRWSDRTRFLTDPDRDKIDTPAWLYADSTGYRVNSYNRPAVALRSLAAAISGEYRDVDGSALFVRGMRRYAETFRYRHPTPDDFFETFQEGAGVDVSWYFAQLFRGEGTIDWRVSVDQREEPKPEGVFQAQPLATFEKRADESPPADGDAKPAKTWLAEIMLAKRGELVLPVVVRLIYDDGSRENVVWTRAEQEAHRYLKLERRSSKKLVEAAIDPDGGYYVDLDRSNNRWVDATDSVAPARWFERAFARLAQALHWQAGIGG